MGKIPVSGRPMTVIAIGWLIWMAAALFAGGDRADQGPADDGS